ncbi:MAG: hypothetical protein AAF702_49620 [Chloroflexota bacterium]
MIDEPTTIKVKRSTKSRFEFARIKLENLLAQRLKTEDAALMFILDDWLEYKGISDSEENCEAEPA